MADNLTAMEDLVLSWSNRDETQLGRPVVTQCLRFAADTAYRELMVPPLENTTQALIIGTDKGIRTVGSNTLVYETSDTDATTGTLIGTIPNTIPVIRIRRGGGEINAVTREARVPVPGDLTTFIHIRIEGRAIQDANDVIMVNQTSNEIETNITGSRRFGLVFNEKADVRTYHDLYAEKNNANYWTRQGNDILLNGYLSDLDVVEIYYYRRLAALGARYIPPLMGTSTNVSTLTDTMLMNDARFTTGTAPMGVMQYTSADGTSFFGNEVPNWLINENEKVILFGALWQAFDYLQDQALSQTYFVKFGAAIEELNKEERNRRASGGNVQVNFNGRGLI